MIEDLEPRIKLIEAKLSDSAEKSKDPKSMTPGDIQLDDVIISAGSQKSFWSRDIKLP
jgi:hypothetical protein